MRLAQDGGIPISHASSVADRPTAGVGICHTIAGVHPVPGKCVSCGSPLRESARFCNVCGTRVPLDAQSPPDATSPAPAGSGTSPTSPPPPPPTPTPSSTSSSPAKAAPSVGKAANRVAMVVVAIAAAVTVGVFAWGTYQAELSRAASAAAATAAQTPFDLSPAAQLSASSRLASEGKVSYATANLIDNVHTTAWAEGASGAGIGQWFAFDFSNEMMVSEFRVVCGYDKRSGGIDRFTTNPRLKTFTVRFSDGGTATFTTTDTRAEQVFRLDSPVRTSAVKVTIDSVYPERRGKHSAKHTSVSEFHVYGYRVQ